MADVFVSYASEDRDRVRSLVELLETNHLTVWWDRNLRVGTFFERVIEYEIRRASCVVVVWTHSSISSHWVVGEAMAGLDRNVLIPVLFDDVEVPLPFNAHLCARLVDFPQSTDPETRRFLETVDRVIQDQPHPRLPLPPEVTPASRGAVGATLPSIAVLPFDTNDHVPHTRELADALAAEVIAALSCFSNLDVVPRRTSFSDHLQNKGIAQIADDLDAQYIVTGQVRGNDPFRIIAELSDGISNKLVWSRTYTESARDLGIIELAIAENLVKEIGGEFLRAEIVSSFTHRHQDASHWTLLHNARQHFISFNGDSLNTSRAFVQRALELLPSDPHALALLASIEAEYCVNGFSEAIAVTREKALETMRTAIELGPLDPVVLKYCGSTAAQLGETDLALRLLRRSLEINPYDLGAWGYLGGALASHDNPESTAEALQILTRTMAEGSRHPGLPFWHHHRAVAHCCREEFQAGADEAARATELQPGLAIAWWDLANALGHLGDAAGAENAAGHAQAGNADYTAQRFDQLISAVAPATVAQARTGGLRKCHLL